MKSCSCEYASELILKSIGETDSYCAEASFEAVMLFMKSIYMYKVNFSR